SGGLINPSGLGSKDSKRGSGFLYSLHQAGKTAGHAVTLAAGGTLLASGAGIVALPFALPFAPAIAIGAGAATIGMNIAGLTSKLLSKKSDDEKTARIALEEKTLKRQQDALKGYANGDYKEIEFNYEDAAKASLLKQVCDQQGKCHKAPGPTGDYPLDPQDLKDGFTQIPFALYAPKASNSSPTTTRGFKADGNHEGLDIYVSKGTIVTTSIESQVLYARYYDTAAAKAARSEKDKDSANNSSSFGNSVVLKPNDPNHPWRLFVYHHFGDKQTIADGKSVKKMAGTSYADGKDVKHTAKTPSLFIKEGDKVEPGDPLGFAGNTGAVMPGPNGDGTHVHLGVVELDPKINLGLRELSGIEREKLQNDFEHALKGEYWKEGKYKKAVDIASAIESFLVINKKHIYINPWKVRKEDP
ncbi:MAG: M23 family metallopeptidase, partial [Elusimicrobiota bacterium]